MNIKTIIGNWYTSFNVSKKKARKNISQKYRIPKSGFLLYINYNGLTGCCCWEPTQPSHPNQELFVLGSGLITTGGSVTPMK